MNQNIKKIIFLVFVLSSSLFYAKDDILQKIDDLITFKENDLSAEYIIETRKPEGSVSSTTAAMFRRDIHDQYLILILKPESDKGKGYLKIGEILWLYDPDNGSFTFTSAKDRFQNTGVRNSDFNRSNYAGDYTIEKSTAEKLGKFDCTVLELKSRHNRVSFPKVKLWISEDFLVRKIEDYSLSGQLLRTTAIPTYQKTGDKWVPSTLTVLDHLVSRKIKDSLVFERTTITVKNPSLSPLPDSVYTKEYLQRMR
ncbi:MAG: outer membrane lipoprotein-sorting protein [Treponemataceae bacterium]